MGIILEIENNDFLMFTSGAYADDDKGLGNEDAEVILIVDDSSGNPRWAQWIITKCFKDLGYVIYKFTENIEETEQGYRTEWHYYTNMPVKIYDKLSKEYENKNSWNEETNGGSFYLENDEQ